MSQLLLVPFSFSLRSTSLLKKATVTDHFPNLHQKEELANMSEESDQSSSIPSILNATVLTTFKHQPHLLYDNDDCWHDVSFAKELPTTS